MQVPWAPCVAVLRARVKATMKRSNKYLVFQSLGTKQPSLDRDYPHTAFNSP